MMQRRKEVPASGESDTSFIQVLPLEEERKGTIKGRKHGQLPRFNFYRELLLVIVMSVSIFPLILPFFMFTSKVVPARSLRSSGSANILHLKHEDVARSVISVETGSVESVEEPTREDSVNGNSKDTSYEYTKMDFSKEDVDSYSFRELYHELECGAHARNPRKPLFTPAMWALMRDTFAQLAEPGVTFFRRDDTKGTKYYSQIADGKGRGAFAARDIKKGELVHDGNFNTAFWNDGLAWKQYIASLPSPMDCDVMEWTWTQEVVDKGWFLCLNLNEAAFLNNGGEEDSNIAPTDETTLEFYALRGKLWLLKVSRFNQLYLFNCDFLFRIFRHQER